MAAPPASAHRHIHRIGPVGVCVEDWSTPAAGRGRMFEQEWLERLSWVNPALLPFIFVPPALWLIWTGVGRDLSAAVVALLVLGGVLAWSLTEYVVHRFLFHFRSRSELGQTVAYLLHGVHHAFPDDDRRWAIPLTVSIPVAGGLYLLCRALLETWHGPFFAGFLLGYLAYDLLHVLSHRRGTTSRVGRFLRAYHLRHHFARPDLHFGISSPFWDYFFRTVDDDAPER